MDHLQELALHLETAYHTYIERNGFKRLITYLMGFFRKKTKGISQVGPKISSAMYSYSLKKKILITKQLVGRTFLGS